MRDNVGSIINQPSHGALPRDIHAIGPVGEQKQRGTGDIYGFLPTGAEVSSVSVGQVPGKGTQ